MNQRVMRFIIGFLVFPLGCGGNDDRTDPNAALILQPTELCSDQPNAAIATFEDANLEAWVRAAISVGEQEDLTCGLVSGLTYLDVERAGIASLVGIQNLTGLTYLDLVANSVSDISPLSGLTSLRYLSLGGNSITDINPLSGLSSLELLRLEDNSVTDIGVLSELTSLRYVNLNR